MGTRRVEPTQLRRFESRPGFSIGQVGVIFVLRLCCRDLQCFAIRVADADNHTED